MLPSSHQSMLLITSNVKLRNFSFFSSISFVSHKFFIIIFHLIIITFSLGLILGERYVVGVGEGVTETDPLERNLIHKLFISRLFHRDTLNSQRDILNSHCDILNYLNVRCDALYIIHSKTV